MNIKEHIDRGHYPKDAKGRALVPTRGGKIATIYATDLNYEDQPIVGVREHEDVATWCADGRYRTKDSELDLLPPPPRKVKETGFLLLRAGGGYAFWRSQAEMEHCRRPGDTCVVMTGEYEEPWS